MTLRESIDAARLPCPAGPAGEPGIFEFRFAAGDPTFAGHFPGHPLLPGIFQIEMAKAAAESILNSALDVREITRAKFRRPVLPDEIIRLELKCSESEGAVQTRAIFSVDGQPAGEVTMLLWRRESKTG